MKKSKIYKKFRRFLKHAIKNKILYTVLFCAMFYFLGFFSGSQNIYNYQKISIIKNTKNFITSLLIAKSTTMEVSKKNYSANNKTKEKIKLLIVPGHDDESGGTDFRGVKEAKINLELALNLIKFFEKNDKFEVTLVRDKNGYNPIFLNYFSKEREAIEEFTKKQKKEMSELVRNGEIRSVRGVVHNSASAETSLKLYGINKWANENNINIVIHIHFNDDPTRNRKKQAGGKYSGFAIYVPESQYSNAKTSRAVAESIFRELAKFYPVSNFNQEQDGIVEDQKLIAIGAQNSLNSAGLLIEYGYIYESQFLNEKIRSLVIRELAFQTYVGIEDFFNTDAKLSFNRDTSVLPHKWKYSLQKGMKNNESVFAFQTALMFEGLYPPEDFDKRDCPITGNFGNCTLLALKNFQKKYSIDNEMDASGELTKNKLNELYSF